jgi:DNA repair exonuclease SbcCD ATPase subunit
MRLSKIEWRNFASYGNKIQSLQFDEKSGLYLVVGENGAGKSSISDVITFGLYGKLEGKKLKDIPNRINGNAWVKITFTSNGEEYMVERGLDPSIFNLYVNGTLYDKAGSRSVQDYLTEDIIQIPNYVFNNTISLSINDFKSFLKMSPTDKKSIIDKIFGFYVINEMKDLLKEEAKSIKENLIRLSAEIDSLGKTLTRTQSELEILSQKIKDDSKDKISDLEDRIKKFNALLEMHNKKVGEFASVESEISSQYRKNYGLLTEAKGALKTIVEKIKFYENDKCPTCTSDLAGAYHEGIKDELNKKLEEFKGQVNEYQDLHNQILGKETEIKTQKSDLNSKGNKITVNINSAKDELRKIKSNITSSDALDSLRKISEDTRENVQKNTEDRSKEEKKSEWLKKIEDVLGDKGIKQLALKSILPSLNSHIADLMISLHLPYTVRFDDDFNASIIHMGEEISISTLSTGEMKKVDFAVLLSVLKLMKIRFSSINLLFLDEIFSSIDPDGVYTILTTLRKICDDLGLNVFVINHAPMPTEIFDYKVDIQKRNNFSDLQIDKV